MSEALSQAESSPRTKVHAIWIENQWIDRLDGYDPLVDWLKALEDRDADVRGQAARALGLRRMTGGAPALIAALRDHDAGVRMRAATALGRIGDSRAVAALCEVLDESDVYARFAIVQALRRMNQWTGALACLKSAKQSVRDTMLLALTGVYDQAAIEALSAAVVDVRDSEFQVKAIEALAEVCRKADPYTGGWWGTQPAAGKPARSKTHDWPGTRLVLARLPDLAHEVQPPSVRKAAVAALVEVNAPT